MEIKIPFLRPLFPNKDEILHHFSSVLNSGMLTLSSETEALEDNVKKYCNVKYAIATSNGSQGLIMLLSTLEPGTTVILPAYSFGATFQAVSWNAHLNFSFVDVDSSGLIDLTLLEESLHDISGPKAIFAVHMYGNPAKINELEKLSKIYNATLFFDSAHGLGSRYSGKTLGASGDAEVFSLGITKCLPAGEGGVITTNRQDLYMLMMQARIHGKVPSTNAWESPLDFGFDGLNARPTEFNMALANCLFPYLDSWIRDRNLIASKYSSKLMFSPVTIVQSENLCSYKDYVISVGKTREDKLSLMKELLLKYGIQTKEYYYPSLPNLSIVERYSSRNKSLRSIYPIANKLADTACAIPIYPLLQETDIQYIVESINTAGNTIYD